MQRLATSTSETAAQPLLRRLSAMAPLTDGDRATVRAAIGPRETWTAGREIPMHGLAGAKPKVVVSGWACRQRTRLSGARQIFDFILPGDFIVPCPRMRSMAIAGTMALTRLEAADVSAIEAAEPAEPESMLRPALHRASLEEEARLYDHIMRLGRLSAVERMGHLLLEFHERLSQIGMAHDYRFAMPLTQEMLADALGLSVVHVNRTLQQLRREGMIDMRVGFVTLLQPAALAAAADYTPMVSAIEPRTGEPVPPIAGKTASLSRLY